MNIDKKTLKKVNRLENKMEKRSKGETIFLWTLCVLFAIYTITLFYPLYWAIISSLKSTREFFKSPYALPGRNIDGEQFYITFENFKEAMQVKVGKSNIVQMFGNSLFITFFALIIALLECTMTGYVLSMYKFPGSKAIYNFMILIMMIPLAGSTPSLYKFYCQTGLYDTRIGLVLLYTGGFGYPFMLLYNFFLGVSWSYGEAAMIDGASDWGVFFKIMLPQALGMELAIAVMSFMGIYGDYTNPYLFLKSHPTLSVGITTLSNRLQGQGRYPAAFAAMLIACVPTWIFYIVTNKKMYGLKIDTGIKG